MIVALVALVVVVLAAVVGTQVIPRNVMRRDEARAGDAGDLDVIPTDVETTVVTTDDGAEIRVFVRGQGTPVVFVHGLFLDHDSWRYQYLDLADEFRIIGVDLRGHGESTTGSAPIGPHRSADDLATVLSDLDLRGVVLVGHSLGGTVVGQLCADHRELVQERAAGLVFVGSFASAVAGEGRLRQASTGMIVKAGAAFPRKRRDAPSTSALAYVTARYPFGPEAKPEHVRFTQLLGNRADPAVASSATVANLDYDVRNALDLDVPSLLVGGSHDKLSTARSIEQLRTALTRSEVVVFENVGHLPMLECRERFNEVLSDFIQRVAP